MVTFEDEFTLKEFNEREKWIFDNFAHEWDYQIVNQESGHWGTYEIECHEDDRLLYKMRWRV